MTKFILFSLALASAPLAASTICSRLLTAADRDRYVEALLEDEGTLERMRFDRDLLIDQGLESTISHQPDVRLERVGQNDYELLGHYLYLSVTAQARGWFGVAEEFTTLFARELASASGAKVDERQITADVRELAARPAVRDLSATLSFLTRNLPTLERSLLKHFENPRFGSLSYGPLEFELTKLIMQYGHTRTGHRVLELGGQGVATGLATEYLPGVDATLLSPGPVTEAVRHWAKHRSMNIVRGDFRKADLRKSLLKREHFQVVAALNQIHRDHYPGVTPELFARHLRGLIRPHGLVIILNDFGRSPLFDEASARAAGFDIVVWNQPREIATGLRDLAYGVGAEVHAADLRAFVLRAGTEDHSRISAPAFVISTRPAVTAH